MKFWVAVGVATLAICGSAQAAGEWRTVRFASGSGVWISPPIVGSVSVDVRRHGRFLPFWTHIDPCAVTFHDRRVRATVSNCSRRLRLRYVALGSFALRYRVRR